MPHRLDTRDPAFESAFAAFLSAKRDSQADVSATVAEIIAAVRAEGDRALIAYTERFDAQSLTPDRLRIGDRKSVV